MNKLLFSIFFLLINFLFVKAQNWEPLGANNGLVAANSNFPYWGKYSSVSNYGSTLYLAYRSEGNLIVKTFKNGEWQQLGDYVTNEDFETASLVVGPTNQIPYIAYAGNNSGEKVVLKAFINGIWERIGPELTGMNDFYKILLSFTGTGIPWISFINATTSPAIKALVIDSWIDVSSNQISNNIVSNMNIDCFLKKYLAFTTGNRIYIYYRDESTSTWVKYDISDAPSEVRNLKMIASKNSHSDLYFAYVTLDFDKIYVKKISNNIITDITEIIPNDGFQIDDNELDIKLLNDDTPCLLYRERKYISGQPTIYRNYVTSFTSSAWENFGILNNFNRSGRFFLEVDNQNNISVFTNFNNNIYAESFNINVLPVKLIRFSVKEENKKINLVWETASEVNNGHFTILKSTDGNNYELLNKYPSKGNDAVYHATDFSPSLGVNYYKLIQTDKDGKQTELGVQTVKVDGFTNNNFSLYPNPIKGREVNIQKIGLEGFHEIIMYNSLGKIVMKEKVNFNSGKSIIKINKALEKGIYLLNVNNSTSKLLID